MKKFAILLLAGGAAGISTPAFAQDESPFGGFYGGLTVGVAASDNKSDGTTTFDRGNNGSFGETVTTIGGANAFSPGFCGGYANGPTPGVGCDDEHEGIDYSARLGYDVMLGDNFLVGVVGEVGKSSIDDAATAFSTTPAFYQFQRETELVTALRGRIGVTAGQALVYGTGGVAYAKMDNTFTSSNTANSFTQNGADAWEWGWQAGGGAEFAISRNASFGVEYLYNRINADDYSVTVGQGSAGATNPFVLAGGVTMKPEEDNFQWHSVRATLNFHF